MASPADLNANFMSNGNFLTWDHAGKSILSYLSGNNFYLIFRLTMVGVFHPGLLSTSSTNKD